MPSKVIIIVIAFMFLGINIFWALLRAHFNPRLTARAKMSLTRAQNIFTPANINSIVLLDSTRQIKENKRIQLSLSFVVSILNGETLSSTLVACPFPFPLVLSKQFHRFVFSLPSIMFISPLQWWKCLSNIYNAVFSGLHYMEIDA